MKSYEFALEFLNTNQGSKSTKNKELNMSPYLSANNEGISIQIACFIAKTQTHMIENIKNNFKEQYKPNLACNSCNKSICDQKHLLECSELIGKNEILSNIPNYQDIFNDEDIKEQEYIASLLIENLKRKKVLEHIK